MLMVSISRGMADTVIFIAVLVCAYCVQQIEAPNVHQQTALNETTTMRPCRLKEEFLCESFGESICLWHTRLCDLHPQCDDGSDEDKVMCEERVCLPGMFKCDSGQCLHTYKACEGTSRDSVCADDSDLGKVKCNKCPTYRNILKVVDMFHCASGECILRESLCDGTDDCPDGSDEAADTCGTSIRLKTTTTSTVAATSANISTRRTEVGQSAQSNTGINTVSLLISLTVIVVLTVMCAVVGCAIGGAVYYRRCCFKTWRRSPRYPQPHPLSPTSPSTSCRSTPQPPLPSPPSLYQPVQYTPDGYNQPGGSHYQDISNINSYLTLTSDGKGVNIGDRSLAPSYITMTQPPHPSQPPHPPQPPQPSSDPPIYHLPTSDSYYVPMNTNSIATQT